MKSVFAFFSCLFVFWSVANAQFSNTYAPKLTDVVILYDGAERDYSPFLYHRLMGETLEMWKDSTCAMIQVREDRYVDCVSTSRVAVPVGELGKRLGNDAEWTMISVNWSNRVQIVETQTSRGLRYSVRVIK